MSDPKLLVIGFGNPLRRDDGVGIAALEELKRRGAGGPGIDMMDGGVEGINLLSILEDYDRAVVLDAALSRDGTVGEIIEISSPVALPHVYGSLQVEHSLAKPVEGFLVHVFPGNSGGPVLDYSGNVVGISRAVAVSTETIPLTTDDGIETTASIQQREANIGLVIPIDFARNLLDLIR